MDSVSSTTFIKKPPCMSDVQKKFLYTKEVLSSRLFLGSYEERRYVSVLKEYRDVVVVSFEETDLLNDLNNLRKKWSGIKEIKWVGITGPEDFTYSNMYCFWVKLTDLPFGQYWFQIKHVKFVDHEIIIQLKCIRKYTAPLAAITPGNIKTETPEKSISNVTTTSIVSRNVSVSVWDTQKAISSVKEACAGAVFTIRPYLTVENITTITKVIFAFLVVLLMGSISVLGHLGEYALKLIREVTLLINAFTPIIIQLIDFLSKIIGGFYILMARVLLGYGQPANQQPSQTESFYIHSDKSTNKIPADWRERNRILRQELLLSRKSISAANK